MKGAEVAWRTLALERLEEPCIVGSWIMKGDYYTRIVGRDYWSDKENVYAEALLRLGINLCPQWVMPQDRMGNAGVVYDYWSNRLGLQQPEQILPLIEALPSDEQLEREFDLEGEAKAVADTIAQHSNMTSGEVLFIPYLALPDFMGPYNEWGYVPYLSALALYPEHIRRYYHHMATKAHLQHLAVARAVERYGVAPFIYGGDDICDNAGPLCSVATLERLYFPELRRALAPLIANDIRIIWHCDGNVLPILPSLIEIGVSGLQGFQEEAGVDFAKLVPLKSRWGRPLILWGCVSVTTTLPFGSPEDVRAAVRRSYQLAGPGRGFGLASTSSIMPEVPDENIDALYLYGREYGRKFLRGEG